MQYMIIGLLLSATAIAQDWSTCLVERISQSTTIIDVDGTANHHRIRTITQGFDADGDIIRDEIYDRDTILNEAGITALEKQHMVTVLDTLRAAAENVYSDYDEVWIYYYIDNPDGTAQHADLTGRVVCHDSGTIYCSKLYGEATFRAFLSSEHETWLWQFVSAIYDYGVSEFLP